MAAMVMFLFFFSLPPKVGEFHALRKDLSHVLVEDLPHPLLVDSMFVK